MNASVNSPVASADSHAETELLALAARSRAQLTAPGAPFELVTLDVNGQQLPAYRNAFAALPELLNAGRVHGARECMVYEGDRWSYDRFYQAADALAGRLQGELGVRAGDRVAIAMRNRPEWAVAFAAAALLGAVPAPLNSFGLRDELLSGLRDVQPVWLLCDPERFAHVQGDLAALQCRAVVVDGEAGQGHAAWAELLAPGAPAVVPPVLQPEDPALILFTSGASSHAKGVLSTQRAVCQALFNIDYIGAIAAMTSPDLIAAMVARGLQPTTLTAVPLFHVSGLHAQLLASLRHGRRLVFMRRWNPALALELIQKEKITQFNGAPSMVMQLLAEPGFDDPAITGSLGGVGFGGAGLPQRLIDEVLQRRSNAMVARGLQPTTLTAVPLFHVSGLHAQLLASLRHGRRLVFMRRWNPALALELIQKEKITQFNGAPSMVMQLLAEPGFDDPAITGSLGGVGFGGAGLPQRLIDEVLQRRSNAMSGIGFGLTETNGVGAASSGRLFQLRPHAAGLPSPIIELRVSEFDGTPLPQGEAGELWMRGVTVMQEYSNQPEETARALEGGWFHTGDIGLLEADGFVRVVDRIKDVINRAGEKIAAAEIESCLLQHPLLVEAAVFAQPDDQTGEAVVAVVVLAPGAHLDAEAVRSHVAARLAAYKVPQQVHVRPDSLPRNPAGKMLKTVLKREYAAV